MLLVLAALFAPPALPDGAVAALGTARFRTDGPVSRFAVSPDETLIAVEGDGVAVFEAATGSLVRRIDTFTYVEVAQFLLDGSLAIVGFSELDDAGTEMIVVDPRTGTVRRQVRFEVALPGSPHICPDGLLLAADNDGDHRIELFSCETGRRVGKVQFRGGDSIGTVAFSPCGRFLVGLSPNGRAYGYDRRTGTELFRHRVVNPSGMKFSHDGRYVGVTGGPSGDAVTVIDLPAAAVVGTVESKPSPNWVAFGPHGHLWIGTDAATDSYDPAAGLKKLKPRPRHRFPTYLAHVARDGATVTASGGYDAVIRYAAATGAARPESAAVYGALVFKSVGFRGRGRVGVFAAEQGWLGFDARTGRTDTVAAVADPPFETALGPDERLLAVATPEAVELRVPKTGAVWKTFPHTADEQFQNLQFSPDGRHLVGKIGETGLRVWDIATGSAHDMQPDKARPITTFTAGPGAIVAAVPDRDETADADAVRFVVKQVRYDGTAAGPDVPLAEFHDTLQVSADGRVLIGLGGANFGRAGTNSLRGYDLTTGKRLFGAELEYATQAAAVTPDGTGVIYGQLGELVFAETLTGQERFRRTVNGRAEVGGVAVSQDGRLAATTSGAIPVLLWDLKSVPLPADVSPAGLATALGGPAAAAYRAQCYLEAHPALIPAVAGLTPGAVPATEAQLRRWADALDARDYRTRRAAKADLTKYADAAWPLLDRLQKETPSAERRAALAAVLAARDRMTPEKLRKLRLAQVPVAGKTSVP